VVLKNTCRLCRSFLDDMILEDGSNLNHSRGNIGVVSLNLPLIYKEAEDKGLDFWRELEKYMGMIRDIHKRAYNAIGKQKAASNPIMFTQGGFYGGTLKEDDDIKPVTDNFTSSFGITALNELSVLAIGATIKEDSSFANEVVDFMQDLINEYKKEDGYRYSLYGSPAESLSGLQVQQFRDRFGVIKGVSDREYFTNSFHLWVGEEISPFEKQDKEIELFKKISGGHIQYIRISNPDNLKGLYNMILRGVRMGLYQGVNFDACICTKCGAKGNDWNGECPVCGSKDYNEINRICGYLGWSRKNGDRTINDSKIAEKNDRISM